jgi:DNA polymerase-3 subunit epsilon
MEKFDFTAIDFETMTAEHTSACAIGIVRVENCVIKQKFYSLIKPIPDNRDTTNSHVHGITPDMVENAPTFLELWPLIKDFFEGQELVCHNAIFDITVLVDVCKYYGIELQYPTYTDTLEITCKGLKQSCIDANIPIPSVSCSSCLLLI